MRQTHPDIKMMDSVIIAEWQDWQRVLFMRRIWQACLDDNINPPSIAKMACNRINSVTHGELTSVY